MCKTMSRADGGVVVTDLMELLVLLTRIFIGRIVRVVEFRIDTCAYIGLCVGKSLSVLFRENLIEECVAVGVVK